ncbi:MAG: OPT family oligopeptide transporter [Pirellulales bacterium]
MAIEQLSDEQVRTMTIEEKDRWWLANVYKGDMPQLTIRSAITGMMLGGVLSLTNLYIGAKTGWTLGVGITSVIMAFAMFRTLQFTLNVREFTILENNCMQSIATAAGYMTAPMISSLAAYMLVTGTVVPMYHTMIWIIAIALLGVLFAFPLKRRFINDEQHAFPEGRAAGVVMDALHNSDAKEGVFKAKLLAVCGVASAVIELFKEPDVLGKVGLRMLTIPEELEAKLLDWLNWHPAILGTPLNQLTVSLQPEHAMVAAGGLMGIRTGVSLLVGACINYLVLAPWMIQHGSIVAAKGGVFVFKDITAWSLWPGVAMMTTASLFAFFSKPKVIFSAFTGLFNGEKRADDCLKDIELPMKVFAIGIPIVGGVTVYLAWLFFDVSPLMGAIAVPLVFVFTLIGANSTALTAITPTGALGKLTQLTFGVLAPGNIKTNLMTAGITGEVASNASNLLMDIKPGYMLGGKPRQQALGHVLGIFAGAVVSVPVFYFAFLKNDPQNLINESYPMPAATIWRAVAEVLTSGIENLPVTAAWAALVGALLGIALEAINLVCKGRFPLSPIGLGLAFVIAWPTCFAMFLGSFIFWLCSKLAEKGSWTDRVVVKNQEPICAGLIAGGALMGIAILLSKAFGF